MMQYFKNYSTTIDHKLALDLLIIATQACVWAEFFIYVYIFYFLYTQNKLNTAVVSLEKQRQRRYRNVLTLGIQVAIFVIELLTGIAFKIIGTNQIPMLSRAHLVIVQVLFPVLTTWTRILASAEVRRHYFNLKY